MGGISSFFNELFMKYLVCGSQWCIIQKYIGTDFRLLHNKYCIVLNISFDVMLNSISHVIFQILEKGVHIDVHENRPYFSFYTHSTLMPQIGCIILLINHWYIWKRFFFSLCIGTLIIDLAFLVSEIIAVEW